MAVLILAEVLKLNVWQFGMERAHMIPFLPLLTCDAACGQGYSYTIFLAR